MICLWSLKICKSLIKFTVKMGPVWRYYQSMKTDVLLAQILCITCIINKQRRLELELIYFTQKCMISEKIRLVSIWSVNILKYYRMKHLPKEILWTELWSVKRTVSFVMFLTGALTISAEEAWPCSPAYAARILIIFQLCSKVLQYKNELCHLLHLLFLAPASIMAPCMQNRTPEPKFLCCTVSFDYSSERFLNYRILC